jgi:uncharacterized membrane protein
VHFNGLTILFGQTDECIGCFAKEPLLKRRVSAMSEHSNHPARTYNRSSAGLSTTRIEAFSDGVFAIALTLLILSVKVPSTNTISNEAALQRFLLEQWPTYFSYALSVVIIGIYWVAHHGLFHYIRRADRGLFWLNILFLLCVTFIPFPTALLGTFSQYQTSVVVYGANLALTGIVLDGIRWYATSKHRLVDEKLDLQLIHSGQRRNLMGPLIYLLAIALSFLPFHLFGIGSVQLCLVLYACVPVLYILPGRIDAYWAGKVVEDD